MRTRRYREFIFESDSIRALSAELANAAQRVYDGWDQDEDGEDPMLGSGGICQDVAAAMCDVLTDAGVECQTVSQVSGEQHVYVVARTDSGVYVVDIPPGVYEEGGGYNWRKIPDVEFAPSDVVIRRLSPDPDDYHQYLDE